MTWEKNYDSKRKKEKPNKLKINPTIAFRSKLSLEALAHIRRLSKFGSKTVFINQAIEMKYQYETRTKSFLIMMIQNNFYLCKHILRQIGSFYATKK